MKFTFNQNDSTVNLEGFHKNQRKYMEDIGKSTEKIDILSDLFKLADAMSRYTQEEALVQLLSKYKRQGYNVRLLFRFRSVYKNIIRWVLTKENTIDPQEVINYEENTILKLSGEKYNNIKNIVERRKGKLPEHFGYSQDLE